LSARSKGAIVNAVRKLELAGRGNKVTSLEQQALGEAAAAEGSLTRRARAKGENQRPLWMLGERRKAEGIAHDLCNGSRRARVRKAAA
jgi:hypothetical protein